MVLSLGKIGRQISKGAKSIGKVVSKPVMAVRNDIAGITNAIGGKRGLINTTVDRVGDSFDALAAGPGMWLLAIGGGIFLLIMLSRGR